jgi:hypothetical protein
VRARRALRDALHELERLGLIERRGLGRRPHLVDRAPAGRRFRQLVHALCEGEIEHARDRELALLLACSGVLGRRLSKGERRIAARHLRPLAQAAELEWTPLARTNLLDDAILELAAGEPGATDGAGQAGDSANMRLG